MSVVEAQQVDYRDFYAGPSDAHWAKAAHLTLSGDDGSKHNGEIVRLDAIYEAAVVTPVALDAQAEPESFETAKFSWVRVRETRETLLMANETIEELRANVL